MTVGFVLSPDFTLLPFAGFIDALRHAADEADRSRQIYCRWTCLGPDLSPIRASCGIEMIPWQAYGDPAEFDYIVVVGGLLSAFGQHSPRTFAFLRSAAARQVPLVGLCTGSFAMAEAGLMDGRRCAVHFRHRKDLIALYPKVIPVTNEMYVIDGDRITCPGGTAAIDIAVELLIHHCGRVRALKGLADMVVDEHRAAHHVARLPFDNIATCGNWRVERAVALMRRHLSEPYPIAQLAKQLGTSVRQLDRAFAEHAEMSPTRFWREIRLQHARWRLLNSSRSVTDIAYECGFSDCAHFVRWFKRSFGETPQDFRVRRLDRHPLSEGHRELLA